MAVILTISDLREYKKQIERQTYVLRFSPVFNAEQKLKIVEVYNELTEMCNDILLQELEVKTEKTL